MKLKIAPQNSKIPAELKVTLPADLKERFVEYAKPIGTQDYVLAQILEQVLPSRGRSRKAKAQGAAV